MDWKLVDRTIPCHCRAEMQLSASENSTLAKGLGEEHNSLLMVG